MFPAGLEPATFRVWDGRDNHYTTETSTERNFKHCQTLKHQLVNWRQNKFPVTKFS